MERSDLPDPREGGSGENEGWTQGDEDRGGAAREEAVPQAGGASGGRADPIAGGAGREGGGGPDDEGAPDE
jgi:hypothetical protein